MKASPAQASLLIVAVFVSGIIVLFLYSTVTTSVAVRPATFREAGPLVRYPLGKLEYRAMLCSNGSRHLCMCVTHGLASLRQSGLYIYIYTVVYTCEINAPGHVHLWHA